MEYEEDDDISFAKWMSSFWGHSLIEEDEKEGRGHRKRPARFCGERRASLPVSTARASGMERARLEGALGVRVPHEPGQLRRCPRVRFRHRRGRRELPSAKAKLSSFHTTRLHASTRGSSSGHLKGCKGFREDQDAKCHCHVRASRTPSTDSSCPETRSNSIQEFAETFERQLHFRSKRSVSLQPEGMKERSERERLLSPKGSSHKKMRGKSEPKREQREDEGPELSLANHNEQFPSQASVEKGYFCAGSSNVLG